MPRIKYRPQFNGLSRAEGCWAKTQFKNYEQSYEIDTYSDLQLIEELVFFEAMQERVKKQAKSLMRTEADVTGEQIPAKLRDSFSKNLDVIIKIKEKLKLFREKEEIEKVDPYEDFKALEKKMKIWRNNNQASRTVICQHCGKVTMLKIKTDSWEAQEHPFFKDRILFNKHLIKLYLQDVITREDIAKILNVSDFYVNWLVDKGWVTNPKHKEIKEEIDKEKTE